MKPPTLLVFTSREIGKTKPYRDVLDPVLSGRQGPRGTSLLRVLLGCALLVTAIPAHSVNFRFLDFSPVRHFTDEDWRLLREAGDDVIENKPDGAQTSLKNPRSGASGTITAISTTKEPDGTVCRVVRVENRARGASGRMDLTACMEPGETWRLVSP